MPGRLPANINVAPNSPIARAHVITVPEMIARVARGKDIVKKTLKRESVKILALLYMSMFCCSKPIFTALVRKGEATKISAIITAIV